jgi:hypothetical protein
MLFVFGMLNYDDDALAVFGGTIREGVSGREVTEVGS